MKHISLSALLCLSVLFSTARPALYKGKIDVKPWQLEQRGDSLHVGITFHIEGLNVTSRQSLTLIPTLVAPGVQRALPVVEVKGRADYLIWKRHEALMGRRRHAAWMQTHIPPQAVVKGYGHKGRKAVEYTLAMLFEPWMKDARLDMSENICGCSRIPRTQALSQLVNCVQLEQVVIPYQVMPSLSYIQPQAEAVKRREMVGEAFLDFVVNRTDIRPDYMNNPRELKKITDMVEEVSSDPAITVRGIDVIGYASPEGTLAGNQRLSEGRANALVGYLLPRFVFPRGLYHVEFGGENWEGLEQVVRKSDMPWKTEVLNILHNIPAEINFQTNTSRKKSLMSLYGGDPYRYMLKEYFPALRKAICKIDYEVRGFNLEEAKVVFGTRPQNLSLNEMYLVANTYAPGTVEFVDVFETAVRMFPRDEVANLNAAVAALSRRDAQTAQRYLDRVAEHTPEWLNASGVAALLRGEYDLARELLQEALEAGCVDARYNLEELDRKLENKKLIGKQTSQK